MHARDLTAVFPPSPAQVPDGLTAPSSAYKRHAWLAMGGLLVFVALYLGLVGYLAWTVWRLLGGAVLHGGNVLGAAALSLPSLFFLAFLTRGLFAVKRGGDRALLEITPEEQPTLFAFLHKLADETGAPRPHRVFLSGRVNAGVFYDLAFWNFLFPSRKNLELGLGLVNALTLDELKAVLAHEYGHFAQRTMAVGRWVYLAQQVAGHAVMSRGIFDRFLAGVSSLDVRIAWVGWILRLFVWAIRALLDTAFRLVVLAHRALSREMELNADRVAVSVSGSDSLVHALHRLGPADRAWEEATSFAAEELRAGRAVPDLFALQSAALDHLRRIFAEPDLGRTPRRPDADPAFRVFAEGLAQPPRMWLSHPPNRDREDRAKELYVPSTLDPRSAWELFDDAERVRRSVTASLLQAAKGEAHIEAAPPSAAASGTAEERFAKRFTRPSLDPRYRGAYLGRAIAAHDARADHLIGSLPPGDPSALAAALDALYPESLQSDLQAYRERHDEELQLKGLADGVLTAPGGVLRYRGREIRRRELSGVVKAVRAERRKLEKQLLAHDRACRAAHLAAANLVGHGWSAHLTGLIHLLHFTTHAFRDALDAYGTTQHDLELAFADGRVSSSDRRTILRDAGDLSFTLTRVWEAVSQLSLPEDVAASFAREGGFVVLAQPLGLRAPSDENLGDWLQAMGGWSEGAIAELGVLSDLTLDRLLEVEAQLAAWSRGEGEVTEAPRPAVVPKSYGTCVVGKERERRTQLGWWERFQTADGVGPGALRAVVATALVLPALAVGGRVGSTEVHVVNGLNVPVRVRMDRREHVVPAHGTDRWSIEPSRRVAVTTTTLDGRLVEQFDGEAGAFAHAVYNVASAAVLVEWVANYSQSGAGTPEHTPTGARRWLIAKQDVILAEPPKSITVRRGERPVRVVLQAVLDLPPHGQHAVVDVPAEQRALVAAHVAFDAEDAAFGGWANLAEASPEGRAALIRRADATPASVFLQRTAMDVAQPAEREARCAKIAAAASAAPGDDGLRFLSLRCEELRGGHADFVAAWRASPTSPWLALAAADRLAAASQWTDALDAMDRAVSGPGFAPMQESALTQYLRLVRGARAAGLKVDTPGVVRNAPVDSTAWLVTRVEGPPQDDDGPVLHAWRTLRRGELANAEREARGLKAAAAARVTLLVGASDGATAEQEKQALAVTPEPDVAWVRIALRMRAGDGAEAIAQELPGALGPNTGAVLALLGDKELAKQPARLEELAKRQSLRDRGVLLAMGVMVLDAKAPAAWRTEVKALLFPFERPYVR